MEESMSDKGSSVGDLEGIGCVAAFLEIACTPAFNEQFGLILTRKETILVARAGVTGGGNTE